MENIYDIIADTNSGHPTKAGEARKKYNALMETSVVDLGVCVRAANHLESIGVLYVKELLLKTKAEIIAIPNMGEKTYLEIMQCLWDLGICNKGSPRPTTSSTDASDVPQQAEPDQDELGVR